MIKKHYIYFSLTFIVLIAFIFSTMLFVSKTLLNYGLREKKRNSELSLKAIKLASLINPFDSMPLFYLGEYFHQQAIDLRDPALFQKAVKYFENSSKCFDYYFNNDLLKIEAIYLLGESKLWLFDEFLFLNKKYPNNWIIQKIIMQTGIEVWKNINKSKRNEFFEIVKIFLYDRYWYNLDLILNFYNKTGDQELFKIILPDKLSILKHFYSYLSTSTIKFDYIWLISKIKELELNSEDLIEENTTTTVLKKKIYSLWDKKKYHNKTEFKAKELIGYFENGKPINNGYLWSNGSIFVVIPPGKKNNKITISARSTKVNGIPAYIVIYSDEIIIGGEYIKSESFTNYDFKLTPVSSKRLVSIKYINDFTCNKNKHDRNLVVKSISIS